MAKFSTANMDFGKIAFNFIDFWINLRGKYASYLSLCIFAIFNVVYGAWLK